MHLTRPIDFAMTSTRNLLLIALLFIGYLLWNAWEQDYNRAPASAAVTSPSTAPAPAANSASPTSDVPGAGKPVVPPAAPIAPPIAANAPAAARVVVTC